MIKKCPAAKSLKRGKDLNAKLLEVLKEEEEWVGNVNMQSRVIECDGVSLVRWDEHATGWA